MAISKKIIFISLSVLLFCASVIIILCTTFIKPSKDLNLSINTSQSINLGVGESIDFIYCCSDHAADVSCMIGNSAIVKIEDEKIIGLSAGYTTIRILAVNGSLTASKNIAVEVFNVTPTLTLSSSKILSLHPDDTSVVSYFVSPSYYDISKLTTSFSVSGICSFSNNIVTAINGGTTYLNFYLDNVLIDSIFISVTSNYTVLLSPLNTLSTIEDNNITLYSNTVPFSIEIRNRYNEVLTLTESPVFVCNNLSINTLLGGNYSITVGESGSFTINISNLNISETFNVIIA